MKILIAGIVFVLYSFDEENKSKQEPQNKIYIQSETCVNNKFVDTIAKYIATFKNGKTLCVEGWGGEEKRDSFFASEFSVLDCLKGTSYAFYGALENCKVTFRNDTLLVTIQKRLALRKDWSIKEVDYKTEYFYYKGDSLIIDKKIVLPKFSISEKRAEDFMKDPLSNRHYKDVSEYSLEKFYQYVKRLEILAISGNQEALEELRNYGNSIEGFCCGLAQEKMQALRLIEEINNFN